jgi:cytochrome b561
MSESTQGTVSEVVSDYSRPLRDPSEQSDLHFSFGFLILGVIHHRPWVSMHSSQRLRSNNGGENKW